ncbi:hypothetical protein VTN96DRAFT_2082 [Rasamsonia emersonii]|uniref:Phosphatidylcholine-sterol O-acyltransferase-like protein n=1 Tax=Rasamsonia emersonii (strain ATCC 16479 / CBS 393.64 / IMI 116815) TaxID=1408163 RepID=A0A0F4YV93_RASE3|nr:hypothetical protein T310_3823 [Rasamsonia emersonii CBS 393.64]KKA22139.1 hypothetical protein T310_3823 [Rasamsonia emersonii CBS 393.64]
MDTVNKPDGITPCMAPREKRQSQQDQHQINGSTQKVSDSDHYLSSDNDDAPVRPVAMAEADEAEDVLGVSISRTQSRMKARQTPAEEKSRIMERSGGYFDPVPDTEPDGDYLPSLTAEPESLPVEQETKKKKADREAEKPHEAKDRETKETRDQPRTSFTRSLLKSGSVRRLTWSGDAISNLNLKKLLPDLSSLTKRTSLSSSKTGSGTGRPRSQHVKSTSTGSAQLDSQQDRQLPAGQLSEDSSAFPSETETPTSGEDGVAALKPLDSATHSHQHRPSVASQRPPLSLRRSASDQSLYVRSLSRTSTLDQRRPFENVHSQVNSRFQAIKDSLQDSSSRLLSMPNFNLPDIRGEWNPGRFLSDGSQRKDTQTNETQPNGAPPPRQNTMYPILTEALSHMTGDVVVMGGYRGSVLRSAKPPHRQLWVPMKVGLNIRKVDLEVGLTHEDEERMEETIIASEVLSHIGPVDICRRLMHKMRKCENSRKGELRVWDYGYDWRLSPHYLSKRLIKFLEGLPCNAPGVPREKRGAFVVAHSLGGLITRHAVNQRPELFAGVVYAGTPQHCVNILGPLRNGDDVLLSSRVLTAQVNFTFRTSYALLPEDGRCFIDKRTKEDYLVDFFSVKSWEEYRFSPCIAAPLPPLGSENRRSLIETLPNSLPSLPKIGLGKRFSTILGSKDGATADTPRSSREEEAEESVPRDHDNGQACAGRDPENPVVENLLGPSTAPNTSSSTNAAVAAATSTIPRADAIAYLERTLAEVLRFKRELAFNESHQAENRYPPFAVLYSKCLPTVYGARVQSREHIKCRDAYDDLAFAAGDGVCLASAAMLPPGYRVIKDGLVKTDRGHVGLLGDLEAVGKCLLAIVKGRKAGVGLGRPEKADADADANARGTELS